VASETTAAAQNQAVGVIRRDPFAMLPFCGYNMGDYFAHWLSLGAKEGRKMPKIFHVNWFRQADGKFLWPGFGDNVRVLRWILDRCKGEGKADKTPIGYVPASGALDLRGLEENVTPPVLAELFRIDRDDWKTELESQKEFFEKFGDRCPKEIWSQYEATAQRVGL
jgi:phosphoenolpyruvate carboxykinase (GTP)